MSTQIMFQSYRHALTKKPTSITRSYRTPMPPVIRITSVKIATTYTTTNTYTTVWIDAREYRHIPHLHLRSKIKLENLR